MNVWGDALFLEQEFHVFLHQRMKRMISFILYVTSSVILITISLICWAKISVCYSFVRHLWSGKCTFLDSLFRLFANHAILNIVMVKINKFLLMPFSKNFKVWCGVLCIHLNGCMNKMCGFSEVVKCKGYY